MKGDALERPRQANQDEVSSAVIETKPGITTEVETKAEIEIETETETDSCSNREHVTAQ
jgi:hypothetical protein